MYLIYIRVAAHNYSSFSTYIHRFTPHSVHSRELLSRHISTVLLRIQFTQEDYFLDIYSPFYSAFSSLKRTTFSTYIDRFTLHSVHSRELLSRHIFTVLLRIQFTQENYFFDIISPFYSAFSTLKRTTLSTYIYRFTPHSVQSRGLLSRHILTVLLRIQFTQEDYFLDIY